MGPTCGSWSWLWTTTVHKAQGSESRAVVVVLSPAHKPLLTRRLLYTGVCTSCHLCLLPTQQSWAHQQNPSSRRIASMFAH